LNAEKEAFGVAIKQLGCQTESCNKFFIMSVYEGYKSASVKGNSRIAESFPAGNMIFHINDRVFRSLIYLSFVPIQPDAKDRFRVGGKPSSMSGACRSRFARL
jgi:hypothetical protein